MGECVCFEVGGGVPVCMYVGGKKGPMVFGRHCVRFSVEYKQNKQQQKKNQQQERQQSIPNAIKRNNVTMAMQCGTVDKQGSPMLPLLLNQ